MTRTHTHTCLHTYRRAHNPTITTSCGENAARLFLEVLLFWKIKPWHKKDSEAKIQYKYFHRVQDVSDCGFSLFSVSFNY